MTRAQSERVENHKQNKDNKKSIIVRPDEPNMVDIFKKPKHNIELKLSDNYEN